MTMQKPGESDPPHSTSPLASPLARGRAFYQQRAWDDAYATLSEVDRAAPLGPADLEQLGWAAALSGREAELHRTFERLHAIYLEAGNPRRAALVAFWLNTRLVALGEPAQAAGWVARAQRLLEREAPESCAEQGYLLLPAAQRAMAAGDLVGAEAHARAAIALGERFGDRDLVAFARQLQGRALLRQGQREAGLGLLDEVMVAAKAGELAPVLTGIVYCAVISSCQQSFAVERAREWTAALSSWCEAQPQLVVFNGLCLVHRSEVLQLCGSWPEAIAEAERASERCARGIDPPAAALAAYQRAEIHRLRGEGAAAAEAYRAASGRGMEPQPGLALLRLAEGERGAAAAAIRRVVEATTDRLGRARYLPAYVEIMLAVDDVAAARAAADELGAIAAQMGAEVLHATAAQADGAVLVASGQPARAVTPLRQAFELWQRIGAPYLAARARVWLGRACAAAADPEGAELQREAARAEFERLGARPDLAALDHETTKGQTKTTGAARGLTGRELEVLRLVSQGKTNKEIAQQLALSEKTVDRHVSNIFGKLDVSTRAAATAYAYQHHLV